MMDFAEIAVFAACWVIVAAIMLWGVFTEGRRGGYRGRSGSELHPARYNRVVQTDWIVVESLPGTGPDVGAQAHMIAAALLASRGIDIESLPAGDIRTEVTSTGDGDGTTRILVRAGAMHASRRRR
jgi:hypothetical protein